MQTTKETGDEGERIALEYLQKSGYIILATNWTWGKNEIDIIAQKDKIVCFVEVKLRRSTWAGQPYEAVNRSKQKAIVRTANFYLNRLEFDAEARFDIISIVTGDGDHHIEHLEGAFYAML